MTQSVPFILKLSDIVLSPAVWGASFFLRMVRRVGVQRLPIARQIFRKVGMLPIRNHYYEPLHDPSKFKYALNRDRELPGVDFNAQEQLALLKTFSFTDELRQFPVKKRHGDRFYYDNDSFCSGDSEILYSMIRSKKPRRLVEIGCGFSTLMIQKAIVKNKEEANYLCQHICIEPFENKWLEELDTELMRKKVEDVDKELFTSLEANDILFIDSSHVIRPQGDVLFEYLEILPILNPGVIVHIHDIFTPKDYPKEWLVDQFKLWNEQYLLEAFLSHNKAYKILGALNYLKHHFPKELSECCPILADQIHIREPGSFWIQKL